jgi:hypothetical protein
MLVAWEFGIRRNRNEPAQAYARIACTPGESNPIAARNFICASWLQWIRRIENIRRCR